MTDYDFRDKFNLIEIHLNIHKVSWKNWINEIGIFMNHEKKKNVINEIIKFMGVY